jgi:hypothetical protein
MSGVNTQYLDIPVGILLVIAVGIRGVAGVVSLPGIFKKRGAAAGIDSGA